MFQLTICHRLHSRVPPAHCHGWWFPPANSYVLVRMDQRLECALDRAYHRLVFLLRWRFSALPSGTEVSLIICLSPNFPLTGHCTATCRIAILDMWRLYSQATTSSARWSARHSPCSAQPTSATWESVPRAVSSAASLSSCCQYLSYCKLQALPIFSRTAPDRFT